MREPESLGDSSLEHELQAMVAVDPAPDFLGRARARISQQRARSRSPYVWFTGFAAAAAAILLVAVVSDPNRTVEAPVVHTMHDMELPAEPPQAGVANAVLTPVAQSRTQWRPDLEVLISAEQADAVEHLLDSVAEQRFVVVSNTATTRESDFATNVSISPIVFEPIHVTPIDEGVFQ